MYELQGENQRVFTKDIARSMGVKMSSVSGMVKHLAAEGYLSHKPYKGVLLTKRGQRIAVDLLRRHRLIELFLNKTLDIPWDEIHEDAEVLEHVISNKLIERIFNFLGRPKFDPHGHTIPVRDGNLPLSRGVPLDKVSEGEIGRVVEVSDHDPEFLRYLTDLKLKIGSEVQVKERAPFGGPIMLKLERQSLAIGLDAARRIRVDIKKKVGKRSN
ncbi:MAG: metal-dependent transcriptional regulator [candidate division Zixibacteria bacterium]|nr:metal-dependent transcriptional regulator [candidate division Zixibacteria bacterium]